jgi:hypothetical protein
MSGVSGAGRPSMPSAARVFPAGEGKIVVAPAPRTPGSASSAARARSTKRDQVVGRIAEIGACLPLKAAKHHRGGCEERERQRDFADDERLHQPPAVAAARRSQVILERRLQIAARRAPGWSEAGRHRRGARDRRGKAEGGGVDGDAVDDVAERSRHERHKHVRNPGRESEAAHCASRCEQSALDQELHHAAGPRRAERCLDRHLPPACDRARQKQARDVGADDEQHETHGGEHREHDASLIADEQVAQRERRQRHPPVPGRVLALEPRANRAQVGRGLRKCHVALQARLHIEPPRPRRIAGETHRKPDVRFVRIAEARRHDADDRSRAAVDRQRRADD